MNNELYENENKTKIFKTAEELFYEKGYTHTSVDEIIERSGTSKGTFYYHYKSKAELALGVLESTHYQHTKATTASEMFSDVPDLVLLALDIRLFWLAYYKDEGFRRFYHDTSQNSLEYESYYIIKTCTERTRKRFSKLEMDLIRVSIWGMRSKISLHVYNKLQMFPCQVVAEYSMRQIFRFFEIPNKIIRETIIGSNELFGQLELEVEKFSFNLRRVQQKNQTEIINEKK